jgi:tetratricopeptide (TPR) repeat protein
VKKVLVLLASVGILAGSFVPLTRMRDAIPLEVTLGFFPPAPVIKALSVDQYQFVSQVISLRCLFYFGALSEERRQVPEWDRLYRALYTATRLDPYNMDAYYFAQAVLTWDAGMTRRAVDLLEYGFAHRTWDWYLPFFLMFDYSYFLKDYNKAAEYAAKAVELKPEIFWLNTLAARYFYEGGRTKLALTYLKEMIATTRNKAIKKRMVTRAEALERILELEEAVAAYEERFGSAPRHLAEVVHRGIIERIPEDPYGGTFYLDEKGRVRTTSKLAFVRGSRGTHSD